MTDRATRAILERPWVTRILALLNDDGHEARIVGGAVRNALLGLPATDIDIATTALPDEVMRRAKAADIHAVPTGIDHGTVTLVVDNVPHEITTLREDIETDGRRAVVRFGRDFRADALRRDFTINALSLDIAGKVHDYAGGIADLKARRVRFIGDPDERIREDYLRILRFFRFSAIYGGGDLDADGLAAVTRHRDGLAQLSRERIRAEMMKLLAAPHATGILRAMDGAGVLASALGKAADMLRLDALGEVERRSAIAADPLRRLMALALRDETDAALLRDALRLTNREVARLEAVATALPAIGNAPNWQALLYRLGPEAYRDALLLQAAAGADPGEAVSLPDSWTPPKFLLTGKDVIALGIAKGPAVGRLLAAAEQAWLDGGLPADDTAQRRILARVVAVAAPE